MNHLENIFNETNEKTDYVKSYFKYLASLMDRIDANEVAKFLELIQNCRDNGKNIFFIGNGGSAATATHFANDLQIGARCTPPIKAISLCDNQSIITAIGNDYGYEYIFTKQLEKLLQPGDAVVAISASGNSPNIVDAINYAKDKGCQIVGLSGFDGGKLKEMSDIKVHIPSNKGEYGPVEDLHMVIDHLVGSYLMIEAQSK